jgi:hypothetical protein
MPVVRPKEAISRVFFALIVVACSHHVDPGISRSEKAEAVLRAFDYTDIALQADPNGWSGTAIPAAAAIGCVSRWIGTDCCNSSLAAVAARMLRSIEGHASRCPKLRRPG